MTINAPNATSARADLTRTIGGGGGFDPNTITGLVAWYDASNAASITAAGGLVSQWNNLKTGAAAGTHMTQAVGTSQPQTGIATINSKNTLKFDLNRFLAVAMSTATFMGSATGGTAFYVIQADADAGPNHPNAVLQQWGSSGQNDHEPYIDGSVYLGWGSTARPAVGDPPGSLATARQITVKSGAGHWSYTIDGTVHYTTATNAVGWHPTVCYIGGAGAASCYEGRVAEIVVYNSVLGTTDTTTVRSALQSKWGTP